MARTISNTDNVIDSRDIISRIEELESERSDLMATVTDALEALSENTNEDDAEELEEAVSDAREAVKDWDEGDEGTEYAALKSLRDECDNITSEFVHGETLISEDYFTEYCQEMVKDIGDLPKEIPAYIAIDWDKTADNLKSDYSEVDFDGNTYLIRDC